MSQERYRVGWPYPERTLARRRDSEARSQAEARLGLRLAGIELREQPYDYERALGQAPLDYRQNLVVMTSPFLFSDRARQRIAAFARPLPRCRCTIEGDLFAAEPRQVADDGAGAPR